MNTRRIYHLDGARFSAMWAGMHRQSALDWMLKARTQQFPESRRICVNAARTEHRLYVRWLRSLETPTTNVEADIDESYDCPLHGEQDGPECARC